MHFKKIEPEKFSMNASTAKAFEVVYLVTKWLLNNESFYFAKLQGESLPLLPKPVPAMVRTKGQKRITITTKVVPYGKIFDLKFQFEIANYDMEYGTEWFVWSNYWPTVTLRTSFCDEPLYVLFQEKKGGLNICLKIEGGEEKAKSSFEKFKKSLPLHLTQKL